MDGIRQAVEVFKLLLETSYKSSDADHEAWAVIPTGKGGGGPSEIGVKNGRAHHLLNRFDRELSYMSERYLNDLDDIM